MYRCASLTWQCIGRAHNGETGGNNRNGNLPVHTLVHKGSEDDVRVRVNGFIDDFGSCIDLKGG